MKKYPTCSKFALQHSIMCSISQVLNPNKNFCLLAMHRLFIWLDIVFRFIEHTLITYPRRENFTESLIKLREIF
mgnify:CR=1 FL=1